MACVSYKYAILKGHQRYGLVLQDKPKGMIRRNRRGCFTRQRVASRWERIMLLSMLGGILLGIAIDAVRPNEEHYTYVKQAIAAEVEPEIVQIRPAYTLEYIEKTIRETFPEDPETAVKIAKCESHLIVDVQSYHVRDGVREPSYGIFQIHEPSWGKVASRLGYDEYKTDAIDNIAMARHIYDNAGKRWKDWSCYTKKMI